MLGRVKLGFGLVLGLCAAAATAEGIKLTYPQTRTVDLVETQFGEKVADPYRWLEGDVRTDRAVADWVTRENTVTQDYLGTLGQRGWFGQRIRALMDYERFGLPQKAGKFYFYTRNSGLQNQSQLFVRKGLGGAPRLLIDPNLWAKDGATALDGWESSKTGKLLAYSVQDGGTDWRSIRVIDSVSGKVLPDELKWTKFTSADWTRDGKGFFYSRYDEPPAGGKSLTQANYFQKLYYHLLGTAQSSDTLVYERPDQKEWGFDPIVTEDGRYLVLNVSLGTDRRNRVYCQDLATPGAPIVKLLAAGVPVGLGTDGPAGSNNDLNLLEELDLAGKLAKVTLNDPRALPAQTLLEMATIGGARVLGLDKRIGSIETGKAADLVQVALNTPHTTPVYNIYSTLVYAAKGDDVQDVMIEGKIIVRGRNAITLERDAILAKAVEYRAKIQGSLSRQ